MRRYRTLPSEFKPGEKLYLGQEYVLNSIGTAYQPSYTRELLMNGRGQWKICEDETHPGPPFKTGGPFDLISIRDSGCVVGREGRYYSFTTHPTTGLPKRVYFGGFCCNLKPSQWIPGEFLYTYPTEAQKDSFFDVSPYGAIGWKRFQPLKPKLDLTTALIEAKDLPGMLRETARNFASIWREAGGSKTSFGPKSVARNWLSTQFGWAPFVNDCKNLIQACKDFDSKYQRAKDQNGKWQRRGGVITDDVYHQVITSANISAHSPQPSEMLIVRNGSVGKHEVVESVERRIWFSASFKYWLPNINKFSFAKNYFGLNFGPSQLYELTPWSWLADWFSNAGDVLQNMQNYDDLTARYAFVMGYKRRVLKVNSQLYYHAGDISDCWSYALERKQRIEANPFGFGFTQDNLSVRQLQILSHLGLGTIPNTKKWWRVG